MNIKKCEYIDVCPSATGWCNALQPSAECAGMVIRLYHYLKSQKGMLIVKMNCFCKEEEMNKLRENIVNQMRTGVVVLPNACTAEYIPADVVVKIEGEEDNGPIR